MKVGIFGGSFDPPHIGHEAIIHAALDTHMLDCLLVVPAFLSPFKERAFAPAPLRLSWMQTLCQDLQNVEVLSYECDQKRAVPTLETVEMIQNRYPGASLFLIVGADAYASMPTWHGYTQLRDLIEPIVAMRASHVHLAHLPADLKILPIHVNISSSKLKEHFDKDCIPYSIRDAVEAYYLRNRMNQRIEGIIALLEAKKAESIEYFDMQGKEYFVNGVIIATTMGERHGLSLLDHLKTELKSTGEQFLHVDADENWIVIDMGDLLIHLMSESYRRRYNLELFLKKREKAIKKAREA